MDDIQSRKLDNNKTTQTTKPNIVLTEQIKGALTKSHSKLQLLVQCCYEA